MRYTRFDRAGVDVSAISVGTWAMGGADYGPVDKREAVEAIRAMVDAGVNHIDTAPIYGSGASEELVGEAIRGIRDKVLLTTKFGTYISSYTNKVVYDGRYDSVILFCEQSLRRLGVDYVDFYLMHWPDPATPPEETMAAMQTLKQQGKVRFLGVSNHSREQIQEVQRHIPVDVIQPPFSMVDQSQRELMEWAHAQGIGLMTYGSLGAGILTGAVREMPNFDEADNRLTFYDHYREPKFSRIMELLKTLDVIAQARGKPVAQVVINWTTQQPFAGTALVGVRNPAEAAENCAALDWALTDQERGTIDEALKRLDIA